MLTQLNKSLFNLMRELEKGEGVCFIVPAGFVEGKFVQFDNKANLVTISITRFSGVDVNGMLLIPMEIIQAWGKVA
jgi:hypothetical protein